MIHYIIRRLLLIVPTLLGITGVVFFVMALSPGGIGGSLINKTGGLDAEAARKVQDYYTKKFGLDRPLLVQYVRWLNTVSPVGFEVTEGSGEWGDFKLLKMPDLGRSVSKNRPVADLILEAVPVTLLLNIVTIPLIYAISITTGIYAARRRGGAFDVTWGTMTLALWSIPTMCAGAFFFGVLVSGVHWFPSGGLHDIMADQWQFLPRWDSGHFQRGWLLDLLWHMVLPVACLTYGGFAFLSKLTRSAMLENMAADFARTARAKGLAEKVVVFRHVLRNSLLPLITVASSLLPSLLAGSIVVEYIFDIRGMGNLMISAVNSKDYTLILAETLIGGLLGLTSYLLADVCYAIADPRVSYE